MYFYFKKNIIVRWSELRMTISNSDSEIANSLDYNRQIYDQIKPLLESILSKWGISTFAYHRYSYNGTSFRFSTALDWSEKYYDLGFHKDSTGYFADIKKAPSDQTYLMLWGGQPKNGVYSALHEFNIWNGCTLCEKHKTFVEGWSFGSTKENEEILGFFINNQAIIKRFILYFKETAGDLIIPKPSNSFKVPCAQYDLQEEIEANLKIKEFIKETPLKKLIIHQEDNSTISLTPREAQCLFYLASGKTKKEIAKILNISPRTIEDYVANLYYKTECTTKSDLLSKMTKTIKYYGEVF